MNYEKIFKPISGTWLQINPSAGESAQTLAAKLSELGIVIDDNAQCCRIILYYDKYHKKKYMEHIIYKKFQ